MSKAVNPKYLQALVKKLRRHQKLASDWEAWTLLKAKFGSQGWSKQSFYSIVKGAPSKPDSYRIIQLAELAGVSKEIALIQVTMDYEKNNLVKAVWRGVLEELKRQHEDMLGG